MKSKIVFGTLKNKSFSTNSNSNMRPTTSMMKSVIFNTLLNRFDFSLFNTLDLFAGTGSLGIESLSLGAKKVTFVDSNYSNCKYYKEAMNDLKISNDKYSIFNIDFRLFLKQNKDIYDLIYIDPPFIAEKYYDESLQQIHKQKMLSDNGIIVLEKLKKHKVNELENWSILSLKEKGEKQIFFLQQKR